MRIALAHTFPCIECRAFPLVLAVIFIDTAGFGIVAPILPKLVTDLGKFGIEEGSRVAGWLLVAYAAAQMIAGPVLGSLSDRFGRRPVLLGASAALAIDYLMMANAPSLVWLFVGRVIAGIGGATIGPASAVLADVTKPEKRGAAFGLIGAAFGVGFIIGPGIGGLTAGFGDRVPFMVAAGAAGFNALMILLAMPDTLAPSNRRPFDIGEANVVGAFRPLLAFGNIAPLLMAWFLWQLGIVVYPATWSFWATIRFGWDATAIGWSLAYSGLLTVLVQIFVTGPAVKWMGERGAAVIGLGTTAVAFFAYALATQVWQVYAFFLVGAFGAFVYPALGGMLSNLVDETRQGGLQGGLTSLSSLAAIIGPFIASQSLAAGTARSFPGAAFFVASVLSLIALVIVARSTLRATRAR